MDPDISEIQELTRSWLLGVLKRHRLTKAQFLERTGLKRGTMAHYWPKGKFTHKHKMGAGTFGIITRSFPNDPPPLSIIPGNMPPQFAGFGEERQSELGPHTHDRAGSNNHRHWNERELTSGQLSKDAHYRIIVSGKVGIQEIERLITKLEFDKEILAD